MKLTKNEIYAKHGIIYDTKTQKIEAPIFGFIPPVLVNGNEKIGKGAYHYSMLPTNREYKLVIDGKEYTVKGTCLCTCMNENGDITCYATKGNYNFKSVLRSLAKKFPESEEHFFRKIDDIKRAVWCVERSYITIPEAMRIISEPLSE